MRFVDGRFLGGIGRDGMEFVGDAFPAAGEKGGVFGPDVLSSFGVYH